jgi:hypothetical protein
MKDSSNVPNMITYTSLTDRLYKEGAIQESIKVLHEILEKV